MRFGSEQSTGLPSRYAFLCAYDGASFVGWQRQPQRESVQGALEKSLEELTGRDVKIFGCSRTDAGVHAEGQVFHVDLENTVVGADFLDQFRAKLPGSIQILSVAKVGTDFHAQLSSVAKRYRYQVWNGVCPEEKKASFWEVPQPLDINLMKTAAEIFGGEHDFSAFTARHDQSFREQPMKMITRLEVSEEGSSIYLKIEGNSFLYKMVRRMVGAIVDVGRGRLTCDELKLIFEQKIKTARVLTASAHGLCLEKVFYKDELF